MSVKRSHMITRSYLMSWADEREFVTVADLEQKRVTTTAVKNATVVNKAYDTKILKGDLEKDFAKIENSGIPALKKMKDTQSLSEDEQSAIFVFLDMFFMRGLYSNQTRKEAPALLIMGDGSVKQGSLNLADRFILNQHMENSRITSLDIKNCPWQIITADGLITGDGAVMWWKKECEEKVSAITFPISPTQMLLIGQEPKIDRDFNLLIAMKSSRWLVGKKGCFNREGIKRINLHHTYTGKWVKIPGTDFAFL